MRKLFNLTLGLALLAVTFALAPAAHAQYPGYLTDSNDTGLPSYGAFISSNIDNVNLGTGGVTVRIPIYSVTGRGKTATTVLQYDSKYWTSIPVVYPSTGNGPVVYYNWHPDVNAALWQTRSSGGNGIGQLDWTETTFSCDMPPQGGDAGAEMVYMFGPATVLIRSNYVYTSPDGSRHQLPLRNNYPLLYPGYCPNINSGQLPTNVIAETDNGQVKIDLTKDQLIPDSAHFPVGTLADGTHSATLGEIDPNGNICCAAGRPAMTYDSASTMNHQIWDVVDSSGSTHQVIIDYVNISVATAFPTTSYNAWHQVNQYSGSLRVISKITLANGLAYNFTYDSTFGEITKITLPTGGYVKYVWTTLAQVDQGPTDPLSSIMATPLIDARKISQRIVSEDGTTGSEKIWTYAYPVVNGNLAGITTVTDPLGNLEKHYLGGCSVGGFISFTGQPSTDGGASYYDPSGKLLKTVGTNWTCDKGALYIAYPGLNLPDANAVLTEGIRNLRQTGSVTTLGDTNQVSETQTDFGDCHNYTIFSHTYTDCRDNPTETREYDYGIGSHGALVRKTDFTYLHNSNSAYLNAHIVDRVTLKSVYDGGSNLVAQTQYGYDTNAITAYTGATNHDDTNYSASNTLRGNVTTVGRWLNTSSTWLTTTNVYNQVGNLVQTTDPGGHTYNLYYDDNYSDGTDRHSQAFLTSVTSPTTSNGVAHVEGKQYFWYTGLTAAVCGQNAPSPASCTNSLSPSAGSPVADYAKYSYDLMNRPATVTHGDGGVTNFTFNESSFPFNVSSSSAIDSSQNLVKTAVIDGLGRVKQTQLNSDPDGVAYVDTTYDSAGQKATVSNPHRSTTSTTDGVTTYLYDALGRTTTVIPPDGTTTSNNVTTAYSGNSVTVTDQAGKQRRSFTDGLGRLIEVDEPSAPAGATNSNGYATISGTELWGGGASAHGTVTITGSEQSGTGDPPCTLYDCGGSCIQWGQPPVYYDGGHVSITVNGHTDTTGYSQGSTSASIAASLVTVINADSSAPVAASVSYGGTVITLTTRTHTASTMTLSSTAWSTDTSGYIWADSFFATPSGSTLTGGANDWADTGTLTLTVGGVQNSVSYGSSSTASSLATALASAVNGNSSSPVTASASGGTINFTDKTQGTPLGLSLGITSNYPATFVPISFASVVSDEYLNAYATAPPGSLLTPMVTLYTYDTLDNLTCVEQHGTATGQTGCSSAPSNDTSSAWRIRRFTYDSLSRLVTAKNPESGTISYTYDSDGNVLTKYDARGITTTMTYDQLHRVLTKTYSDGTPTATYIYDVATTDGPGSSTYPIGRLVEVKNSNAKEVDSYDSRGRIAAQWQCTPLNCGSSWFNLTYAYNFAGGLISESTPMGFTLTPSYDSAARLKQLTSSWSDAQHPANLLTVDATAGYTPAGALAKMTYGNGLVETSVYNNRLQPTQLRTYNPTTNADVLNLTYGFTNSAGANNGNVVTFISTATQVFMRTYTYDELNRLSTMSSPADASGCYGLSWTYDAWGNRLSQNTTSGACGSPSHGVLANNRLADAGFSHDSSGNMTADNVHGYTYNGESELTQVDGGSTATYVYDASGQRVRKIAGGVSTDYVYDPSGRVVAEIQGSAWTKGYTFAGSHLLAQYNGVLGTSGAATVFALTDHLGSSRVMTTVAAGVSDSMDYLPYGELLSGGTGTTHEFTGKERDAESGLDDFDARFYSSALGRFVSADWSATPASVPYADFGDPQSLNLYSYVRNLPMTRVDADGHCPNCDPGDQSLHMGIVKEIINSVAETINTIRHPNGPPLVGDDGHPNTKGDIPLIKPSNHTEEVAMKATGDFLTALALVGVVESAAGLLKGAPPTVDSKPYELTPENQARMEAGKPPIGTDGHPVELHHDGQNPNAPVKEMTRTEHRLGDNYRKNHSNTGQQPSKIDRAAAARARKAHWKDQVPKP